MKIDVYAVGIAYAACLICWKGSLNPARALGSAFVSKSPHRFQQHWIYWVGPILGAVTGAFTHEYIFHSRRKSGGYRGEGDQYSMRSEDDMIDDLERAKQYKANIMQDFQDPTMMGQQQTGYGRTYGNKRPMDPIYGGTKSMYNQPVTGNPNTGMYDRYNDGTKSMYSGYDNTNSSNLRRSRSIHAKFSNATNTPGMTRRNPYDYLPDEPQAKPDIMQSSMVTNMNGTTRLAKSANPSPRYSDNYANEKLADSYDTYGTSRMKDDYGTGRLKDDYDTTAGGAGIYGKRTYSASGTGPVSDRDRPGGPGDIGGRGDFQRMSRMRSEFYSPQYNASFNQQNGCSISTNAPAAGGVASGVNPVGSTSAGPVGSGYHAGSATTGTNY